MTFRIFLEVLKYFKIPSIKDAKQRMRTELDIMHDKCQEKVMCALGL